MKNERGQPQPDNRVQLVVAQEYIDENGHVRFDNYPDIFEQARQAILQERGIPQSPARVTEMAIQYRGQVRAGDLVAITTDFSQAEETQTCTQGIEVAGKTTTSSRLSRRLLRNDKTAEGDTNYFGYKEIPGVFEEARVQFGQERGVSLAALADENLPEEERRHGWITRMTIRSPYPIRRDLGFSIVTAASHKGPLTLFTQELIYKERVLGQSQIMMALVDVHGQPQPVPQDLIDKLR